MTPMPFFQPLPEPEPAPHESARFYRTRWDQPRCVGPFPTPGLIYVATR